MKEKISTEMQDLICSITQLSEKYKGNISFVGSFVAFDKNSDIVEDRLFCYGTKEVVKEQLRAIAEEIVKSKDEMVNI